MSIAECPVCGGDCMVPGETGPTGDDPEVPCKVCQETGYLSEAYAHAYKELEQEIVALSNLAWLAEQEREATQETNAKLRRENEELKRKWAPPADTARGRRPLPY